MIHYSIIAVFLLLQLSSRFAPSSCFSFPKLMARTKLWTTASSTRQPFPWSNSNSRLWINASSSSSSIDENYNVQNKGKGDLRKEAALLQARAKEIMAEARAMEVELLTSRTKLKQAKTSENDDLIDSLFPSSTSSLTPAAIAIAIAERLRSERWSPELVYVVVDRIFERQMIAVGKTVSSNIEFPIGGRANVITVNQTEYERLGDALDALMEAAAVLDNEAVASSSRSTDKAVARRWDGRVESGIRARLNELELTQLQLVDRNFASEINRVANSNQSVEEFVRRALNMSIKSDDALEDTATAAVNASQVLNTIPLAPMWVPSSFLPFIISSSGKSTLGPEQVEQIKDNVLQGSRFFVTSSDSIPGAAIFRGNIRTLTGAVATDNSTNHTAIVFGEIQGRLEREGLADLVQLFFMPDPEWRQKRNEVQSGPKPVLLALSKAVSPDTGTVQNDPSVNIRNTLAVGSSLVATFAYSISMYSLNPKFFKALVNEGRVRVLATCIPVFLGIISIQFVHEAAHYFVAKRREIKIGKPLPLFSPGLGLYGCITQLKSFPANRAALLDFALSGPFAAIAVSLGCIVAGISLTTRASTLALSNFPFVPAAVLKSSFLVGSISSSLASKTLMVPLSQPIPIHPLFVIGYSGLIASALNLLPIFRLDGGRAFSAAMGSRQTEIISVSALLVLISQSLSGGSGIGLLWGLMVLFFQRREEIPARDEVTEVDNFRFGTWLFSQLLSAAVLIPFPGYR